MHPGWGVPLAYALGSIPFALIAGRLRGIDLRAHGSGNLGATNALRVLGARTGIAVYVLDTLKGFLAVMLIPRLFSLDAPTDWAVAYAVAAVAGHVRPLFLGFRPGGKGVATAGGAFLAIAPAAMLIALGVFTLLVLTTGYVSIGSLAATVVLIAVLLLTPGTPILLSLVSVLLGVFLFWSHRANIARLRRGEEHRFRLPWQAPGGRG
jgi:acyl phosphate:glycerol-3-phosphate acyltransferase